MFILVQSYQKPVFIIPNAHLRRVFANHRGQLHTFNMSQLAFPDRPRRLALVWLRFGQF
jgi:hypothetical protein